MKSAPFCTLFAGLCSTNKSATFLLFAYRTLVLFSPPSSLLPQTLWQICLLSLPVLSDYNGSPGNRFSREATRLISWRALLAPSAIPCCLSPLILDWRRTVSSKFFDTQVPSISTAELVLPRHARCVLSRLRCNGHSLLLNSYLSRIGRIENSSCSDCVHFSSHSPLSSYGLFVSLRPLVQALGSCPASGAPWFSAMSLSLGRGRVTTTTCCHVTSDA